MLMRPIHTGTRPNSAWFCFFFFQAEDGIRDKLVTGVQTCALPISDAAARSTMMQPEDVASAILLCVLMPGRTLIEIGRASCREKSVDLGGRRIIKKKKLLSRKAIVFVQWSGYRYIVQLF